MTKNVSVPEGYKITELGMMPEDWDAVEIGQLVDTVKNGFASGKRDENGIVQIRMNNVTTEGTIIFDKYLKVPIPKNIETFSLKKGDFLFNNTNSIDLVGKSAIFCESPFDCTFSNHFTRIRFKQNLVLPEIILLNTLILWRTGFFKTVAIRHVGQAAVHSKYLLKRKIPLPPLPQQQKIASILSKVDEQIEQTEQIIEKTEILKKGLMQKLLTKGIGHTKFKKTELGDIPEEWDVCKFIKYMDIKSGKGFKLEEYSDSGIKLLRIDNVSHGKIVWDTIAYLPHEYANKYQDLVLEEGDLLLALNRPITQNKLKIGILKQEDLPSILYQRVGKITFNRKINNCYVYYWLTKFLPDFISKKAVGSDQPFINLTDLRKMTFFVPSEMEQQKIASILSKVDSQIQKNQNYLTRLRELKKGLMQDLLTGKVRVCV